MLERVPLLEKELGDFEEVAGVEAIERIRALAEPFRGARILHVNATAYGGGVAELLATHVPLLQSLGIDAEWQVIHGSDEFFAVTKAVHNALQGGEDVPWDAHMQKVYLEKVLENALLLEGEWDYVIVHDPQPAALLNFIGDAGVNRPETKWIWRCHIDLTNAREDVWEFFRPYVERHDASVWTMDQFIPASLSMDNIVTAPPCIDPLSVKNLELPDPFVHEICKQYGIDTTRPIVCQVSRYDPWKDPVGVIEAFRTVREEVPDAQLVLAGSMATDDPEGFQVWEQVEAARGHDRDIHLLSNIQQVGNVQINAFQRAADVVIQKSLREGFGLTVAEGLWKGRPVIGGRAGGIVLQIREGQDGYLVDSVEECASRTIELLANPDRADEMGISGKEHVRQNFLSTRELEDWLTLFGTLAGQGLRVIVVSNRGPFRFEANADGSFTAHRGAGGVVTALMPLLAQREDATWVAAAISEDDRAAVAAGATAPPGGVQARLLALDPHVSRLHYDVISNGVIWFLHHGLFDLARRPRFDRRFREAWEGYVEVNRAFSDAVVDVAAEGEEVLVQDYQLALVPQMLRASRPDLHVVHFTHTPFCGPSSVRVLPEFVAHALCASMASCTTGFHTERWARAFRASAVEVLGPDTAIGHTFAASFGPDPATLASELATPEVDAEIKALEERVGDRKLIVRSDRMELSKNIVRGFLAYDLLLEEHPELRERVTFAALLNPSRESLPEYLAYRNEVELAAQRVNERWGTSTWEPVILDTRDNYSRSLAGLACSDVLLVNPVRDGLNLVALEGPLANRRDGVLCLSREAGAHDQLHHSCLSVQPFDLVQTAATLHEALVMDPAERATRATELRAHARANPPAAWLETQLRQAHA